MASNRAKKSIALLSALSLLCTGLAGAESVSAAKKKTKLAKKSLTVTVGKTKKIKIKNPKPKSKAVYKFKSKKKKIATVNKKGVVKGVKAGSTTIIVTEKKGSSKKTLGKVAVTVVKAKNNKTKTSSKPAQNSAPAANTSKAPASASAPVTSGTPAPATDTPEPVFTMDPKDPTYEVTWPELPLKEEFNSADSAVIKNSDTDNSATTYKAAGGVDNSGYAVIKKSDYNGPTVFLDNRLGNAPARFLVSAYVKAESEDDMYKQVQLYGGNTYDSSKYVVNKNTSIVTRKLNTEWEQILKSINVPAHKFCEVRVCCSGADFGIDQMEAKLLSPDEIPPVMKPQVERPAPENAVSETFTMSGDKLKPYANDGNGYEVQSDGSVTVQGNWKYYAIAFDNPVNLDALGCVELNGTVSGDYRISFRDIDGTFFDWKYPTAFKDSTSTTSFEDTRYAYYLILGTKGDAASVNFKLKSITMKPAEVINTDGITSAQKPVGNNNPIAAVRFMADPYAIEYNGTVYVYGTNDSEQMKIGADGKRPSNNYSDIKSLNCFSSKDMVNWTDEGIIKVAGAKGPAKWASNSWAPAVAYKKINGKDKFFIYFADNGSGIGVLEADSPTGPFRDPIGTQLVSRDTPNCPGEAVPWLFDPAVLVDDDGQGYLYFGGIGELKDRDHPKCIRVAKLKDNMIELASAPVEIDAPAAFEDSGINKFNGKYYYSYCTNWDSGKKKRPDSNYLGAANIAYMVSDSPMGPWSKAEVVLKSPGNYFSNLPNNSNNNNHHCMFQRGDKYYMFSHSQKMAADMDITEGYRTTGVDVLTIDADGKLESKMSDTGVEAESDFDPYQTVEAETFAWADGVSTIVGPAQENSRNNRVLSDIHGNDFVGLERVAFGDDGASSLTMSIANTGGGSIDIFVDDMENAHKVGTLTVKATGSETKFEDMTATFSQKITGTHKLFFKFRPKTPRTTFIDTWSFSK